MNFLQVDGLVEICKEHLQSKAVTQENAVEMWRAAVLYDMDKLKAVVLNFMAANWKNMKNSPGFKQLPREYTDTLIDHLIDTHLDECPKFCIEML